MPRARKNNKKTVKNKLWIYTEGRKTEQIYIKGYISDRHNGNKMVSNVVVEDVKENTADSLIGRIKRDQNTGEHKAGDKYWVAYDRESKAKYSNQLHAQALSKAKGANIEVALSGVCIEQYLLWHFCSSQAAYTCCDDLLSRSNLKKYLRTIGIMNYDKGDPNLYKKLKDAALIDTARTNAFNVNQQVVASAPRGANTPIYELEPYSNFYQLLDEIDKFLK
jgi:hypothetical protein